MKSKWIKASDRLPNRKEIVLLFTRHKVLGVGFMIELIGENVWIINGAQYKLALVDYWMPIESPEEEHYESHD